MRYPLFYCSMEEEYILEGHEGMGTVVNLYESYSGDYWVVTDESGKIPFGYARLASMPQFAEWGSINPAIFERDTVWEVDVDNWEMAGPEDLNIVKK